LKAFASDNYAGVHPKILEVLAEVNKDHVSSYGKDEYTERAELSLRRVFSETTHARFLYNGTSEIGRAHV
jgi:threonine aldolase